MSDSVTKWFEMQEEKKASLQADKEMASAGIGQENNKAYRILIDYNIEDIREAVKLHEENKLDE
jgi:hypothetical protein